MYEREQPKIYISNSEDEQKNEMIVIHTYAHSFVKQSEHCCLSLKKKLSDNLVEMKETHTNR